MLVRPSIHLSSVGYSNNFTSKLKKKSFLYTYNVSNTVLEHVCRSVLHILVGGLGENALLPNSSKIAWNFQTLFYIKDTDSLMMMYVYIQISICHRDISMTVSLLLSMSVCQMFVSGLEGNILPPNSSETACLIITFCCDMFVACLIVL